MNKLSIVFSGPKHNDYCLNYAIKMTSKIFPESEIIISTNDKNLVSAVENNDLINKIIISDNIGELPSLKFPISEDKLTNNNINKQTQCCLKGILAASNDLVLRLRTDQILLDSSILKLWDLVKELPIKQGKQGRIITSSIFTINPRYSERMPYHISDMLQLGYKQDLIHYFSAPEYPFEYATWYERTPHDASSNTFERSFRSRYAVEQWLALHYIFDGENNFPISFHNDCNNEIIKDFENHFIDYFISAHPSDIGLRANKFKSSESYYNTQCYSTYESLSLLEKKYPAINILSSNYSPKGMSKKYFELMMPIIYSPIIQYIIKKLTARQKKTIKKMLNGLSK